MLRAFFVSLLVGSASAAAAPVISTDEVPGTGLALDRSVLAEGLENPWGLAFLPDGSMLITERPGRLRLFKDGALVAEALPGLPEVATVGQGGLMDIALDPDFAETKRIFFTFSTGTREQNKTAVGRATLDGMALKDVSVIWQNPRFKEGGQHFGARLLFLPDKTLLVSVGDGGNPPSSLDGQNIRDFAQDRNLAFGKILRMDRDGQAVSDNPFFSEGGNAAYVWSLGHRNIQGLARDAVSGRVYASEHGALGGDELNLIEKGKNYGWPVITWSREYSGATITEERHRDGMEDPLLVWQSTIAPSGLVVPRGALFTAWAGNVLAGGLMSQDVRRVAFDEAGAVSAPDALRFQTRVRDVREGPDGALYVLTDERSASRLIRIMPRAAQP